MRNSLVIGLVALVFLSTPLAARGDTFEGAPVKTAILPSGNSSLIRASLEFDLSGVHAGPGRCMNEAFLQWTPSGVPEDAHVEFAVSEVTSAWDPQNVEAGTDTLATNAEYDAMWDVDPMDYDRVAGLVRLNVGPWLRNGWVIQPRTMA
jgi:hypothetical protein